MKVSRLHVVPVRYACCLSFVQSIFKVFFYSATGISRYLQQWGFW